MMKTVFMFSGQGSQYPGMGKNIYNRYGVVKRIFFMASDVLNIDMRKLCFEKDKKELNKTKNAQLAICLVSFAMYNVFLEEVEIEPSFLLGNSLGEFTALMCSGAIEFPEAMQLVQKRANYMQEAVSEGFGTMSVVIGVPVDDIEKICSRCSSNQEKVVISNYNLHMQSTISGERNAVERASILLKSIGARIIPLNVDAPFHSPYMEWARIKFKEALNVYKYNEISIPCVSSMTGLPYNDKNQIAMHLSEQLVRPVRLFDSVKYIESKKVNTFIEMGPGTILRNLLKSYNEDLYTYSMDDKNDFQTICEASIFK